PEVKKIVSMNFINRRDEKLYSAGQNSNRSTSRSVPNSRQRRSAVQNYYIDVAALLDYKLYSKFLALANNHVATAMQNILEHYAFVFSG
ncbi:A disintegrin and metalloproteinase with thrombospondin motifs 7, partial [Biomphalaria glabrata]